LLTQITSTPELEEVAVTDHRRVKIGHSIKPNSADLAKEIADGKWGPIKGTGPSDPPSESDEE
jgi:hypothetical protein